MTNEQPVLPGLTSDRLPDVFFSDTESAGEYTGERLAAQRPETYRQIAGLLAEGLGVKRVAAILNVSQHTVQAVRDREPEAVATLKEKVSSSCRSVARLCLESIRDHVLSGRSLAPRDAAWIAGVLLDKAELLSGSPTSRVSVEAGPGHADLADLLDSLRARAGAEMGLGAGKTITERDGLVVGAARAVAGVAPAGAGDKGEGAGDEGEGAGVEPAGAGDEGEGELQGEEACYDSESDGAPRNAQ